MGRDTPIALRRSPRRSGDRPALISSTPSRGPSNPCTAFGTPGTNTTTKQKKRARPSDSDSIVVSGMEDEPMTPPSSSKGQPTRHRAIPSTKRRKLTTKTLSQGRDDQTPQLSYDDASSTSSASNEVNIFPLRAILDDRVKRRIRRNGLSEEMNVIYGERKQRAKRSSEEMTRLRDQLAAKEIENEMLREQSSLLRDTSRIEELEHEISSLRQGMGSDNSRHDDWDMAAGDGFSDDGSILDTDDHFFRDDTTVEVEDPSSPTFPKQYMDTISTLTPPSTSPTKSSTPEISRPVFQATRSDAGVQASFTTVKDVSLETEVTTLRCELVSIRKLLEAQEELGADLKAKLSLAESDAAVSSVDPDHQLQMDIMLQTLSDRTATIVALNESLASLGSPGSEASYIVSTLKEAFRSAREELEDLGMHDISRPTSAEGTDILNSMLKCLRASATQVKQYEMSLEDYRTREEQLRQQLNDRGEAMSRMSSGLRQKDDRIFKLEVDLERAEVVVDGYRGSLADARRSIVSKVEEAAGMKADLESMISVATDLEAQLAQMHVDREVDVVDREARHNEQIVMRDATVLDLQNEIASLKEALEVAQNTVSQLQADNSQLQGNADRDKKAARDTVQSLRTQLLQSLQMSEAFLA